LRLSEGRSGKEFFKKNIFGWSRGEDQKNNTYKIHALINNIIMLVFKE